MDDFITNLVGVTASIITITSFQRKTTRSIFFTQIFSTFLWVIHFFLLGALSGALMNAGNMTKAISFVYLKEKYKTSFVIIFSPILWITFFYFIYETPSDCLPLISGTLGTFMIFFRDNRYIIARASLLGACCWIAYALIQGSIPALITDTVIIISIIIGMIRHEGKPFKLFRLKP